jgi:hypothetical protein
MDIIPVLDRERFIAATLYKKLWIHDYLPCFYPFSLNRMVGRNPLEKAFGDISRGFFYVRQKPRRRFKGFNIIR